MKCIKYIYNLKYIISLLILPLQGTVDLWIKMGIYN